MFHEHNMMNEQYLQYGSTCYLPFPTAQAGVHHAGQLKASRFAVHQGAHRAMFSIHECEVFVQMLLVDVACNEGQEKRKHGIKPRVKRGERSGIRDWTSLVKVWN